MGPLAIEGGTPVRDVLLPYGRQTVDDQDIAAVTAALSSAWLTTGPEVEAFEEAFAVATGARYAIAVSSGTAALHAAAFVSGIQPGHEAIVSPLTFVASANCIRYCGGAPVFADVRRDTLCLSPEAVEARLTERCRAIVCVDYAGQPADLAALRAIADQRGLSLIEDASHSLGATYEGRPVGSLADLTTFSLHPVKHITAGEGGVVTTDDPELAAGCRRFRNHGIDRDFRTRAAWEYAVIHEGYNYRLSDLQCALARSQLTKLSGWLARRREIAARYTEAFSDLPAVAPPSTRSNRKSAWHLYVIRLRLDLLRVGRREVFAALRAENIGVNVHYVPIPWHPHYGEERGTCPVAEEEYERLLSLPMFPALSDADVDDVITAVRKVTEHYAQ